MAFIKKNNPLFIFTVVLGLLVFLHWTGIIRPLENFLSYLIGPVSEKFYFLGTQANTSYSEKRTPDELLAEIEKLKLEVAKNTITDSHWKEVEDENKKLRDQIGFISSNNFKAVLANIVSKEESFYVTEGSRDLVIDKGTKDGLRKDLGVLSDNGIIIGKILEARDTSSRICLITTPGCQLAASLQNENKTKGITDGSLGLTIEMSYIPQLEKVSPGDTIITSGLGSDIPRGLVIGKVSDVRSESNEVWQDATIEPLINFNDLTVVSVVIP